MRNRIEEEAIPLLEKDKGEAGTYYKSCTDTETIERQGISGLDDWLQATDEVHTLQDLTDFMVTAELFDFSVFFSTSVSTDQKDPKHYISALSRGRLTLPGRQYYDQSAPKYVKIRAILLTQVTNIFKLSGLSPSSAAESAQHVLNIETAMAKGMVSKSKLRKMNQKMTTIAELEDICPSVLWTRFFKDLEMYPVLSDCNNTDTQVGKCGVVAIREQSYFKNLETSVLSKFGMPEIRAFLRWRVLNVYNPYLTEAFRTEMQQLRAEIYGISEIPPTPKRCFRSTLSRLPDQTSKLYVDAYFPQASKVEIRWMLQRIRNEYSADISRLDWMEDGTRARALKKLSAMEFQIGYPAGWQDLRRLPPLTLSPFHYLENSMMVMVRSSHRERQRLYEGVERVRWSKPAAVVNAFYSPDRNALFIPAGILQSPFYLAGGAAPRNYGGIGSILGHEMSHSLDDSGSRYDEEGRLDQWWDPGTLARFKRKTRCVAEQFGGFTDALGEHISGNLTLGETIADAGVRPRAPAAALAVTCVGAGSRSGEEARRI
jgi:putative endopeptidase